MLPTIVVNAYNRPLALERLLASIQKAAIPSGARLILSIDAGGDQQVRKIAETTSWPHGEKEVHVHKENLGLVEHLRYCGGLSQIHGDIVYLEDDLVVSRQFYTFACRALEAYRTDGRIAGVSLNRIHSNGYTQMPFEPALDASDAFFAQIYWYQGQAYTPQMWAGFERWWTKRRPITPADGLHPLFLPHPRWHNDFFPDAMHYLAETGRTFVFPRESHTTNFGDAGTHFPSATRAFQVPLQHRRVEYRLGTLEDALAVYDSFFEILPEKLAPAIPHAEFDVDLNGSKPPSALRTDLVLTTRPVRRAQKSFALALRPPEMNVLESVPGTGISLARRDDVLRGAHADRIAGMRLRRFHRRGMVSLRQALLDRLALWLDRSRP